jgi:intracellular septation protein
MSEKLTPGMKAALEYGPLAVFLGVYILFKGKTVDLFGTSYSGFVLATGILIPLMMVASLIQWRKTGRVSPMQLLTLVLVVGLGALTVWLNDPTFFKMKPTFVYLLFAALLSFSRLTGRNWLQQAVDGMIPLTDTGWRIFTQRLIALFIGLAVANEIVWRNFSESTWVYFKLFGLTGILIVFIALQASMFSKHQLDTKNTEDE